MKGPKYNAFKKTERAVLKKRSCKENQAHRDEDRLSNLPDEILHYILSLSHFQIFDVVELGVLSKRWNLLWLTIPYINIDIDNHYHRDTDDEDEVVNSRALEKYRSFINWVLTRQGESRLLQFRLDLEQNFDEIQILRWLRVVAQRNIQELDISFDLYGDFSLPLFIAVNDSLRVLKITLQENRMRVPSVVLLSQLRSLELIRIEFSDGDFLQRLFSGCPSLESFKLIDCVTHRFSSFDISSTHLRELIIENVFRDFNYEIKVSCPNLVLFKYVGPPSLNYILENVCSVETVWLRLYAELKPQVHMIRNLKKVHHVKDLNLYAGVVDGLTDVIDELIRCPPSFPNLKSLSLEVFTRDSNTQVMFLLLDHCPNLEVFTLVSRQCYREVWDYENCELQYEGIVNWRSHPHLKTVKFVEFDGSDYQLNFLRFLFKNAKSLEKLDIVPKRWLNNRISLDVIRKVLMFLSASSGITVTFLDPQ